MTHPQRYWLAQIPGRYVLTVRIRADSRAHAKQILRERHLHPDRVEPIDNTAFPTGYGKVIRKDN